MTPIPTQRHWVPFRMYEGILFNFQLPLQKSIDDTHSPPHRKAKGAIWHAMVSTQGWYHRIYRKPELFQSIKRKTSGISTQMPCQMEIDAYTWAADMSPLCNISKSLTGVPVTMGCWRWSHTYTFGQVNHSLHTLVWADSFCRLHALHWLDFPKLWWAWFR